MDREKQEMQEEMNKMKLEMKLEKEKEKKPKVDVDEISDEGKETKKERRTLDGQFLKRIEKFDGKHDQWDDWSFTFKMAINATEQNMKEVMGWVESKEQLEKNDTLVEFGMKYTDMKRWSGELYEVLCTNVRGEAKTKLRGVEEMDGFAAWRAIHRAYNPTTPAKALQAIIHVFVPPKITDDSGVVKAIEEWELNYRNVVRDYKETISESMHIAVITSMVPDNIKEMVFQHAEQLKDYKQFRE